MTAPVYRDFLHTPMPHRLDRRWAWQVGDGPLHVLGEGLTWTRWGAMRARDRFAATCRTPQQALLEDLAAVCEQLHRAGIDVSAEVDERGRVCVHPLCPCSDVDHRRVLLAFCRVVGPVRWEVNA
ncbi:hypothetical protein FHR83_007054 [Actinoplanes campanulatus]|uniref:Uncharacterized protein n=1 Tax=Actinoplanes campanulatus TaxID=113559 RepID=A0A7W5AN51_9ACTN|nr:hypothetical protein [Actinoplanes campanulatus]MBB3099348.1 hypothetical protein [Actinoplanes campanulatus]GGN40367.1 hypothetical protein GCM10010109_69380 [Actinoplanes campanulatus]GID40665.1 hypothetical protein Aca09nite_71710 [Actinoplanes campanulatus]